MVMDLILIKSCKIGKTTDGLQFDLTGLDTDKYYYLEADVYIDRHTLEDSGIYLRNRMAGQNRDGLY